MSQTPSRINPQQTTAWLISASTANDAVIALNTIKGLGWTGLVNTGNWSIGLTRSGSKDTLTVSNGSWIVSDGLHVDFLSNADYIATYTSNVPLEWAATTTAPVMVPLTGQRATLTCPAPTSANGPWTYSVVLTDVTADTTINITDSPTSSNGVLSWAVSNLVVGDQYTAQITCGTQYGGDGTKSLATEPVTAVA